MNNILICTDGSEYSEGAVREGIGIAKKTGARITALSVIDYNPEFDALAPDLLEKMEEQAAGYVKSIKIAAEKEGITCKAIVTRSESPYLSVSEEAAKEHADMIVMGRRGRTGLKRLLMGSVTKRTIGHAPCNVLVVPRNASLSCNCILAATDGSRYSEAAVRQAAEMAKACGAKLVIVTAVHSGKSAPLDIVSSQMQKEMIAGSEMESAERHIAAARTIAEKAGVRAESLIYAGNAAEVIVHAAKGRKAELIVVGSHGRTGIDRLLLGSVAERVIGTTDCSTLVVKAR